MTFRRIPGRVRPAIVATLVLLYAVMWVGGVVAYMFRGGPRPDEGWTAPAFLLLAALIVFITTRAATRWLGVVLLVGFIAEYVGVRFGWLFGRYEYTAALAPGLFGVPVVISCAWMVLVTYVRQMLAGWRLPAWLMVPIASAWTTAIDLVVDPVAAGPLAYWSWLAPGSYYGVPARNFAGWYVVSLVIFSVLTRAPSGWPSNPSARRVGASIIAFFAIIAASRGLMLAAAFGVALCAVDVFVAGALRRTVPRRASGM